MKTKIEIKHAIELPEDVVSAIKTIAGFISKLEDDYEYILPYMTIFGDSSGAIRAGNYKGGNGEIEVAVLPNTK